MSIPTIDRLEEVQATLEQVRADIATATATLATARADAIASVLRARDLDLCYRAGVLLADDPELLAARDRAATARGRLVALRGAMAVLQQRLADALAYEARLLAGQEQAWRGTWAREQRPDLAEELDQAEQELADLINSTVRDPRDHNARAWLRAHDAAKARRDAARAKFEAVVAQAPEASQ